MHCHVFLAMGSLWQLQACCHGVWSDLAAQGQAPFAAVIALVIVMHVGCALPFFCGVGVEPGALQQSPYRTPSCFLTPRAAYVCHPDVVAVMLSKGGGGVDKVTLRQHHQQQ
jgi:hypothetical protein